MADQAFGRIEASINIITQFADSIWTNPQAFKSRISYSLNNPPADRNKATSYRYVPGVNPESLKKELDYSSNMDYIFTGVLGNSSDLSAVYMATESGLTRRFPWTVYDSEFARYDPRKRPWYGQAIQGNGAIWTELYVDAFGQGLMVTCARAFYAGDKKAGVVAADITLKSINELITPQIGQNGYAMLLDSKGNVIAKPNLDAGNLTWKQKFDQESLLKHDDEGVRLVAEKMNRGESGISRVMMDNEPQFIAYAPIQKTGWSLAIVMPVKEIIQPALDSRTKINAITQLAKQSIGDDNLKTLVVLVVLLILMMFLVVIIASKLSRAITDPIAVLGKGASLIGSGNLQHNIQLKTGDELEDLAETFNRMSLDLQLYIHNLKEATAKQKKIESELEIAHSIQSDALPKIFPPFPDRSEFNIFAQMEPALEVGGDLYDFFFIDEHRLFFLVGDVSGKGVPASLFMMIVKTLLKNEANRSAEPKDILKRVNDIIAPDNESMMFVTVICAVLDTRTGELKMGNAGHNPPLVYHKDAGFSYFHLPKSIVLGPMEGVSFTTDTITLKPGEMIFMYSDGVTEAMDIEDNQFGEPRFADVLNSVASPDPKKLIVETRQAVQNFVKLAPQSDDITMLCLQYTSQKPKKR